MFWADSLQTGGNLSRFNITYLANNITFIHTIIMMVI